MNSAYMKPMYDTNLFCEIWDSSDSFLADYNNTGTEFTNQVPTTISQENALMTYLLLFSRYGNNPIANYDVTQFKNKIFTTINNHAYNPSTAPSAQSTNELDYIDQQNVAKGSDTRTISGTDSKTTGQVVTRSKMDAYAQLWELVATDVTNDYIAKFKKCFKQFIAPERNMIYVTEED